MTNPNNSIITTTPPQSTVQLPTSIKPTHTALTLREQTVITQSAVPKISLDTVKKELESKGLNDLKSNERDELQKIKNHICRQDFDSQKHEIDTEQCPILTSQIQKIHKIVSSGYKEAYKPLIKVLFEQELGKFTAKELEDEAVIMHTLIKIEKICNADSDTLGGVLQAIIVEHKIASLDIDENNIDENNIDENNIDKNCQIITSYLNNNPNSLNLMTSLYANEELDLKDPFESIVIDDDSLEEHGWFASIKHAFFHPFEFVKETIWGKKKVNNSTHEIYENDTETAENEHDDHSKSSFESIKNIFAWIPYFGSFFSTHDNESAISTVGLDTTDEPL